MPRRNKSPQHRLFIQAPNSCLNKRRYTTENEAKRVAEIQMLQHLNLELSIYQCDQCRGWHL